MNRVNHISKAVSAFPPLTKNLLHRPWKRLFFLVILVALSVMLLGSSAVLPSDQTEQVRAYTRDIEFDYVAWTLNALGVKAGQLALGTVSYLPEEKRQQIFLDYLDLINQIQQGESDLYGIYANPDTTNPQADSADLRAHLQDLYDRRDQLSPVVEFDPPGPGRTDSLGPGAFARRSAHPARNVPRHTSAAGSDRLASRHHPPG